MGGKVVAAKADVGVIAEQVVQKQAIRIRKRTESRALLFTQDHYITHKVPQRRLTSNQLNIP